MSLEDVDVVTTADGSPYISVSFSVPNKKPFSTKMWDVVEESLKEDINKVVINPDEDDEIKFEADDIDSVEIESKGNTTDIHIHREEEIEEVDDFVVDDEFDDDEEVVDLADVQSELDAEFGNKETAKEPEMIVPLDSSENEEEDSVVDDAEVNAELEAEFGNKEEQ